MLQSSLFGRSNRIENKVNELLGSTRSVTTASPGNNLPVLQSTPPSSAQASRLLKSKDDHLTGMMEPEACYCTVQGKRPYQEDQFAICPFLQEANTTGTPETHFYGVFDGHAGGRCSKAIAAAIPVNLTKDDAYKSKLVHSIKRTFARTNDQFLEIAERMRLNDGSTAVCCIIRDNKLVVANVGDSRAILISGGKSIALTKDHKPSAPEEQRRIASFGGVITYNTGIPRVQGVLAVSRAFGNYSIRNYIRADPDIVTRDLVPEDDFIVIASDGLWDVYRNSEVAEIVYSMDQQGIKLQRIVDHLVQNALLKGSLDNVTCVLIRITHYCARTFNNDNNTSVGASAATNRGDNSAVKQSRSSTNSSLTPKYDAKAWGTSFAGTEDEPLSNDLEALSVYYPADGPTNSNGITSRNVPLFTSSTIGLNKVVDDSSNPSNEKSTKQLSRSRSSNRLSRNSSKNQQIQSSDTEREVASETDNNVDSIDMHAENISNYSKRSGKSNITDSNNASAYAVNRTVKDSNKGTESDGYLPPGQLPFPSSAYRALHRPFTQASSQASGPNNMHLEAVGSRTGGGQKPLFATTSASYAAQQGYSAQLESNTDSSGFNRSYVLFGGNSMVPVMKSNEASQLTRPTTSATEIPSSGKAYVGKRSEMSAFISNRQGISDGVQDVRPNSAAALNANSSRMPNTKPGPPTLMIGGSNASGRYSGGNAADIRNQLPTPHSPIATNRKR